jgi:3-hydroxyacyl-[acyl-carrier-protein] dehydratase
MNLASRQRAQLQIAADHPAFAGHFPGMPIVPGVVLLDEALHAIGSLTKHDLSTCHISSLKFLSPLTPGETAEVLFDTAPGAHALRHVLHFEIVSAERKIAVGSIRLTSNGNA